MNLLRPVVLCADDFGMTDGVSRAILALAGQGCISATSAMTNLPAWRRNAPALKILRQRIGIGLHLNLTTGRPLGAMPALVADGAFPPLNILLRQALTQNLPLPEIRREIECQLDAFEEEQGRPPDFLDGHQHVHVLPGIRRTLLEVLSARGLAGGVWLRDPSDRVTAAIRRGVSTGKALTVQALALGFRRDAAASGFTTNRGFSGFSPLRDETDVGEVLRQAFLHLGPEPVVMCHPGEVDAELRTLDPAVQSRPLEAKCLASEAFRQWLEDKRIVLVPKPMPVQPRT